MSNTEIIKLIERLEAFGGMDASESITLNHNIGRAVFGAGYEYRNFVHNINHALTLKGENVTRIQTEETRDWFWCAYHIDDFPPDATGPRSFVVEGAHKLAAVGHCIASLRARRTRNRSHVMTEAKREATPRPESKLIELFKQPEMYRFSGDHSHSIIEGGIVIALVNPMPGWEDHLASLVANFNSHDALVAALEEVKAALKTAVSHIDHMAAFISTMNEKHNAGYSFEPLGEDMWSICAPLESKPEASSS